MARRRSGIRVAKGNRIATARRSTGARYHGVRHVGRRVYYRDGLGRFAATGSSRNRKRTTRRSVVAGVVVAGTVGALGAAAVTVSASRRNARPSIPTRNVATGTKTGVRLGRKVAA